MCGNQLGELTCCSHPLHFKVHKVLTLEALHKTSLETQEIVACPLTPGIQGAENHLEVTFSLAFCINLVFTSGYVLIYSVKLLSLVFLSCVGVRVFSRWG